MKQKITSYPHEFTGWEQRMALCSNDTKTVKMWNKARIDARDVNSPYLTDEWDVYLWQSCHNYGRVHLQAEC